MNTARDKLLFTPGPLTTSRMVKQAMLSDAGSRDRAFIALVKDIRYRLVHLAQATEDEYQAVLMQGSGTMGVESVLGSTIPANGKLLVAVNGAYGKRMVDLASRLKIETVVCAGPENKPVDSPEIEKILAANRDLTHLACVHCETTTGILNPLSDLGSLCRKFKLSFIVDAMSSFGALPLPAPAWNIDFLISSANKCIEGVPGFSFILARRAALEATQDISRSVSLDLFAQWEGLERDGQFRFTPPTHAILAFHQALQELQDEGGVAGRNSRYVENHAILLDGMQALGFKPYLNKEEMAPVITSFLYPESPSFQFKTFYEKLSDSGFLIYPGKLTEASSFRIGNIGRLFPADMRALLSAIKNVMEEMQTL